MVIVVNPTALSISGAQIVPTHIDSTESFTIPQNSQALYNTTIDAEGVIDADGVLVEV